MNHNSLAIPTAIVIAAAMIAGAIYLSGQNTDGPARVESGDTPAQQEDAPITVRPVDETDHIRGNPNASILLVEYSDYECPFCKRFHETMQQLMDEYGVDGKVAWVYRHFPLQQLHPNAPLLAEAGECIAELGGNDSFWTFSDLIFEERPQNDFTEIARLPEFSETAGVDPAAFQSCLDSGKYTEMITDNVKEAIATGGQGTPHTIVLVGDQVLPQPIKGAIPFENYTDNLNQEHPGMKEIVADLIAQIEGGSIDN